MTANAIARRLIAKHGSNTAYGLCRGRVGLALRRRNDAALYLWHHIGNIVERLGNVEGWT